MITIPSKKPSRTRVFLLVIGLLGLILTSIFMNRRSLHELQQASASLYKDRLVASDILIKLTSAAYQKRLALETHMLKTPQPEPQLILPKLSRFNYRVDSLLTEFEQTRLTASESGRLRQLKQRLLVYNALETQLSTHRADSPDASRILLVDASSAAFDEVAQTLEELSAVQLTVGEKLLNGSRGQTNYSYVLTALQIGLVLLIGLSVSWYRFERWLRKPPRPVLPNNS